MGRGAPPPALTACIYYHKSYEQIKEKSTLTIEEMESFGQGRYMHMRTSAAHLQFTHQYHLRESGGIGYERRRAELEGNREAREAAALQVLNTQLGQAPAPLLGGGSVVLALLAGGLWIGLLYYCCYEYYAGYVRLKLNTDMRDIAGFYLSRPDNCFWVAEAKINSRPQIIGIVAVEGKELPDSGQKYGELFRMSVSSTSRRTGLGWRLGQTVINFCKERGFSKIVLQTTSKQSAAVALYYKMGFKPVRTHKQAPWWGLRLVGVSILRMEKILQAFDGM
ncbi:probable N-acetyltransferase CML1 [Pygocentrus nattereri]|uniref:probable N-acetyltransferase CML1 n=1 Tax=Pygocentrus nattereri TaxID=42514 RepID=UPI0018919B53|nr:probable N-acetyltransferase CML1 [Pygocentrus nattereri]